MKIWKPCTKIVYMSGSDLFGRLLQSVFDRLSLATTDAAIFRIIAINCKSRETGTARFWPAWGWGRHRSFRILQNGGERCLKTFFRGTKTSNEKIRRGKFYISLAYWVHGIIVPSQLYFNTTYRIVPKDTFLFCSTTGDNLMA